MCQVRNIRLEDQTNSFFLSFGQVVYIFEESPKSIQDVIVDVLCPHKYSSNREKCDSPGAYVTIPRSFHGFGKLGALLFVQKVPFMLQEHVKTTRTDKTRFFFNKIDEIGTQQTIVNVPYQSTKYGNKKMCVENIYEPIGYVYYPTRRNE